MQTMKEFTVSLPEDLAKIVRDKVEAGEYPDESAVIADSLAATFPSGLDPETEAWLHGEVAAAYDEFEADPSQGRTAEQVLNFLDTERARIDMAR